MKLGMNALKVKMIALNTVRTKGLCELKSTSNVNMNHYEKRYLLKH